MPGKAVGKRKRILNGKRNICTTGNISHVIFEGVAIWCAHGGFDFEFTGLKIFTREHLVTLVTYPFFYGLDFFRRCPEYPHVSKIVLVPNFDTGLGHSAPIVFRG